MSTIKYKRINTEKEFSDLVNKNKAFNFHGCEFNCNINIIEDDFSSISFTSCKFFKTFRLNTNIKVKVDFSYSIFNNRAYFENSEFHKSVSFEKAVFNGNTSFENAIFHTLSKVRFYSAEFKQDVNFNNTRFEDLADFWDAKFHQAVDFYKTDFLGVTVFAEAVFLKNVLFSYSRIDKLVIFRGTEFKAGLDLSLAIILGEINSFSMKDITDYTTTKSLDEQNEEEKIKNREISDKRKRETFRILKHYNIKQSNSIDSVKHNRLEHAAYASELWERVEKNPFMSVLGSIIFYILLSAVLSLYEVTLLIPKTYFIIAVAILITTGFLIYIFSMIGKWLDKKFNLKEFFTILSDYLIFSLNRYSNNHGTSYWRGIAFTFLVGWAFFYSSLLTTQGFDYTSFDWEICKSYFKYYFDFMNPTHRIDYLKPLEAGAWSYLWDFLGRVFISYGIYQTVQAFRKYKKG